MIWFERAFINYLRVGFDFTFVIVLVIKFHRRPTCMCFRGPIKALFLSCCKSDWFVQISLITNIDLFSKTHLTFTFIFNHWTSKTSNFTI